MENSLAKNSSNTTPKSSDSLIREWLFRFCAEQEKDVETKLPIWLEAFGGMDAATLEPLFRRAFVTIRYFPKVAEILEPWHAVKKAALPEEASEAWQTVLSIRRKHYNPDLPQYLARALAELPERIRRAARAAGVFQEVSDLGQLHVWKKMAFLESYMRWDELEENQFLFPDGEIRNLLADVAEKALPTPSQDWKELHARGLEYAKASNIPSERAEVMNTGPVREAPPVIDFDGRSAELQRQAERFEKSIQRRAGKFPQARK